MPHLSPMNWLAMPTTILILLLIIINLNLFSPHPQFSPPPKVTRP